MTVLLIPSRFCGPSGSGNGGWTAGALAALTAERPQAVEVTLRRPPPLDVAMAVEPSEGGLIARVEEQTVAQARLVPDTLAAVEPVREQVARDAEATYAGHRSHPFPRCFSCGIDREPGDGLRIFPGHVSPTRVAATWVPGESTADPDDPDHATVPITWAALDCVSAWAADVGDHPMVLGRMTAAVDALPRVADRHVVVGEVRVTEGRKTYTASTLYDPHGRVIGRAEHIWFAVDPAAF